jgi:hypothetical protein
MIGGFARAAALTGVSLFALLSGQARASDWEPFPDIYTVNDFGGVGLLQTPTARFAPDGQLHVGGSRVAPYERYFVTMQATSWLEASLRYSSVSNRLFSGSPEFSGDQTYKDRGLDIKIKLLGEGALRPAIAIGARDFLGTGLFSSEYIVMNKRAGPFDTSFGIAWGNLGSRGHIKNPFRLISDSYGSRDPAVIGGGALTSGYFKGPRAAFFGGLSYDTPLRGVTLKAEYDSNDYQTEPLSNRFRVSTPVNVGVEYRVRPWLNVGASFERGNRVGLHLALTTNFNSRRRSLKIDPPAPPLVPDAPATPSVPSADILAPAPTTQPAVVAAVRPQPPGVPADVDIEKLRTALARQGAGLLAADFASKSVTMYVAQSRFRNMATGLGRIARSAFSVLPPQYVGVTIIFVESGLETMSATMYRADLEKAVTPGRGSLDELFMRTEFDEPPLAFNDASYQPETKPGFFYAIRPGLRTTLGRPEQFILYQLWLRLHGQLELGRGLSATGSVGINLSDNFDQLRVPSDSVLPHVRSDIKEYLREGRTAITHLQADYNFNIAPSLYGHVYGGLLEEMFGGVGGEVLYRPYDANWAVGAEITYAKQRDYDQFFSFRDYDVVTGHVTGFYHFEDLKMDALVKAGRYLAKDWGATFQLSRTFKSGISVGAYATFTDVSAAEFGEGRYDKGLFMTIPLDILYVRNVRSAIGIAWRPLIRDGGQAVIIRRPLLGTTGAANMYTMRNDWREILE